jgi:integrase/recombinase XerC
VGEDRHQRAISARLDGELEEIFCRLDGQGRLSPDSCPRIVGLAKRFRAFAERAYGVVCLADVTPDHASAFIASQSADGRLPSVATMRLRRSTLRLLFRAARELGLVTGDPTVDLVLPSRTDEAARPLTDLEVQLCRRVALEDLTSTRLAVPWALAEATARTAEIPHLIVADLDLAQSRVWIHGSSNTEPRWGALTRWGVRQLERHLRERALTDGSASLTYRGTKNAESRRAHSSQAIREVLQRAGRTVDPSVRPQSLAAWAGRCVLSETGRIELAARALGMRSLDGAARFIGWDWATGYEAGCG